MELLVPNSSIRQRKPISASEQPFLDAIVRIVAEHEPYWPISLRRVHYSLLNQPVVRNARSGALYANDYASYHALTNLLLRARIDRHVPWKVDRGRFRQIICSFTRAS